MTIKLDQNYPQFFELNGIALNDGYIYIGVDGLDPTTNSKPVYLDANLTTPIAQPLRTTGGYIYYNGNPVNIFINGAYSITVKNSLSEVIYTKLSATVFSLNSIDNIASLKNINGSNASSIEVLGYYTKGDGGGGTFYWDSTSTETDNGGTIIQTTGVTTGRWKRVYSGAVNVKWFGAKVDGITNDTILIQNAIDNSSTIFIPNGTCRLDSFLTINNGKQVILDKKCTLKRITSYSSSIEPIIYIIDSYSELKGGTILSENNSPNGVVVLGHKSSTDNRNAWWWKFSDCNIYANSSSLSIGVALWSGQVTYSNIANYFGYINNINIYGGGIGLFIAEMANAHNISNIQFWNQSIACLKIRGGYANNINNFFCHTGSANGLIGVYLANKTVSTQDSTFNSITNFTVETGGTADISIKTESNCTNNRIIGASNVAGGTSIANKNDFIVIGNSLKNPIINGDMIVYADSTATAINIRGRSSDNISNVNFKSNDGVTTFGYLQNRGNGEIRLVSSTSPNILTFYADSNETFRAQVGGIAAGADNARTCGTASLRWSTVYAGTGTINTSDDRLKTYLTIEDKEILVAKELKKLMKKYKFNDSIENKGEDKARIHFGTSAQSVKKVFEDNGLNPFNYALLCHDVIDEQSEEKDEEGNIIKPYIPSSDRYGIRYDELLCFIMSAL